MCRAQTFAEPSRGFVRGIAGYILAEESGYVPVLDEPGGRIGHYDLPITGAGVADLLGAHEQMAIEGRAADRAASC